MFLHHPLEIRHVPGIQFVLERKLVPYTKGVDLQLLRIGAATEELWISVEEVTAHLIGVAFAVALWANPLEIVL